MPYVLILVTYKKMKLAWTIFKRRRQHGKKPVHRAKVPKHMRRKMQMTIEIPKPEKGTYIKAKRLKEKKSSFFTSFLSIKSKRSSL